MFGGSLRYRGPITEEGAEAPAATPMPKPSEQIYCIPHYEGPPTIYVLPGITHTGEHLD